MHLFYILSSFGVYFRYKFSSVSENFPFNKIYFEIYGKKTVENYIGIGLVYTPEVEYNVTKPSYYF